MVRAPSDAPNAGLSRSGVRGKLESAGSEQAIVAMACNQAMQRAPAVPDRRTAGR